ncbi:MAG: hypothetical protein ACI4Q6_06145 [Huintestinicola sp.]
MKNIWHKKKKHTLPAALLIFAAGAAAVVIGLINNDAANSRYMTESIRSSISKAAVLCYSAEGAYPDSLGYLEEHYGISYDKEKYIVHYSSGGGNVPPAITVALRAEGGGNIDI